MSIYLIPNTAGLQCASMTPPTLAAEYDSADIISGPRNRVVRRLTTDTATQFDYNTPGSGSGDTTIDSIVVTRVDLMRTNLASIQVIYDAGAGGVSANNDNAATVDTKTMGIKSQDYCATFSEVTGGILRAYFGHSPSSAFTVGKIYLGKKFSFGVEPTPDFVLSKVPEQAEILPATFLRHQSYAIEASFSLFFRRCSQAKLTEFLALSQIFNWPVFLYDDDASIFSHKLEHVIVLGYEYTITAQAAYNLSVSFGRLKHYA